MKNLLLFLLLLNTGADALLAQAPACHSVQAGNTAFARLGQDAGFRNAHPSPQWMEGPLEGEMVVLHAFDGSEVNAYYLPGAKDSNHWLLVFHEWWGLNDHMKHTADSLAAELPGVHVLALDLYDGQVTTRQDKASELMQGVEDYRAQSIIEAGLRKAGRKAEIATIGWCMGGGYSLQAALEAKQRLAGCILYYGMPIQDAQELKKLGEAPVLGIFAKQDQWITPEKVEGFRDALKLADVQHQIHFYDARHAFANPSNPQYDKQATADAWNKSLSFLQEHLLAD